MPLVDQRTALGVLTKPRLLEIVGALGLEGSGRLLKPELINLIAASARAPFPRILEMLSRNELKAICRAAGIDDSGRQKAVIADRILGGMASGLDTLTRAALIDEVAAVTGLLKKDAGVIVDAAIATMIESLRAGSPIEIRGFGSFRHRDRGSRLGHNPKTGAKVKVPAKRVCYFKPGKILLEIVNA